MFLGNPDLYIGSLEFYIGSWTIEATIQSPAFPDLSPDLWLYRSSTNRVVTGLSFGTLSPEESVTVSISAQYRGFSPVKVLGFYIVPIDERVYDGTQSHLIDYNDLIRWADHFTKGAVPPGTPGLEISQTHWDTQEVVTHQVKSGNGDAPSSLIPYIGREGGILDRDQALQLTFRITAPSDTDREILKAGRFNFGFDIGFIELPPQLEESLINGGCESV